MDGKTPAFIAATAPYQHAYKDAAKADMAARSKLVRAVKKYEKELAALSEPQA